MVLRPYNLQELIDSDLLYQQQLLTGKPTNANWRMSLIYFCFSGFPPHNPTKHNNQNLMISVESVLNEAETILFV